MPLPLFDGCNHVLDQNALEVSRVVQETRGGTAVAGWELAVPPPGPDGAPFMLIFVGPTAEHRCSAFRLHMMAADGGELPGDATVLVESYYKSGSERQTIFTGEYRQFLAIPDQNAPDSALAVQKRVEAGEDYLVRVEVTVPEDSSPPDPTAADSSFALECVKIWWNETA